MCHFDEVIELKKVDELIKELGDYEVGRVCSIIFGILGKFKRKYANLDNVNQTVSDIFQIAISLRDWNWNRKISCLTQEDLADLRGILSILITPVNLLQSEKTMVYTTSEEILTKMKNK